METTPQNQTKLVTPKIPQKVFLGTKKEVIDTAKAFFSEIPLEKVGDSLLYLHRLETYIKEGMDIFKVKIRENPEIIAQNKEISISYKKAFEPTKSVEDLTPSEKLKLNITLAEIDEAESEVAKLEKALKLAKKNLEMSVMDKHNLLGAIEVKGEIAAIKTTY